MENGPVYAPETSRRGKPTVGLDPSGVAESLVLLDSWRQEGHRVRTTVAEAIGGLHTAIAAELFNRQRAATPTKVTQAEVCRRRAQAPHTLTHRPPLSPDQMSPVPKIPHVRPPGGRAAGRDLLQAG